jgi:hypothetical protein
LAGIGLRQNRQSEGERGKQQHFQHGLFSYGENGL